MTVGDGGQSVSTEIIDLYLCHNGADKDWVRSLAEQLESETVDGTADGRLLRVFFDEWDIDFGANVVLRMAEGLQKARYVGVVLSPDMLRAPWPTFEWTDIVAGDPTNAQRRLIPIFYRDGAEQGGERIVLPAPFRVLKWIDFRSQQAFRRSFQQLIRKLRDLPPARGRRRRPLAAVPSPATPVAVPELQSAAAPDRISEAILSNLLPVGDFPRTVWSAPTSARTRADVYSVIDHAPPCILQEQRLYTFADLSVPDSVFNPVISRSDIRSTPVTQWRGDADRWRWFINLLNRCLRNHLGGLPLRRDEKGRDYFLPKDGQTRIWSNGADPSREVAARKVNSRTGDEFWVHQAAWLQFQTLGDSLYLLIDPVYVFTSDGTTPLGGKTVGPLSMAWTGRERNAAILRHVVFWSRTLGKGQIKINMATGALPVVISGIPALARTPCGIEFDHVEIGSLLRQVEDELGQAAENVVLINDSVEDDEDEHGTQDDD